MGKKGYKARERRYTRSGATIKRHPCGQVDVITKAGAIITLSPELFASIYQFGQGEFKN
jgi:hypothetical protein